MYSLKSIYTWLDCSFGNNYLIIVVVRTKDGGRLYQQYHYWAQLLCMKGDGNQVENSTNELPRKLYSLYRECTISEEARNA